MTEVNQRKQRETREIFERQKQEFERLRSDVQIKLKFLDENRVRCLFFIIFHNFCSLHAFFFLQVKVMQKQLLLFHNAIAAYFSGNQKALESTMKQFSINVKTPNAGTPSWIEK